MKIEWTEIWNRTKRFKRTDDDVYYNLDGDSNTVKRIIFLTNGK